MLTPIVDTHLWSLRKKVGEYANQYLEATSVPETVSGEQILRALLATPNEAMKRNSNPID